MFSLAKISVIRVLLHTFWSKLLWRLFYGKQVVVGKNTAFDTGSTLRINGKNNRKQAFLVEENSIFRQDVRIKIGKEGFIKIGDNAFFNDRCHITALTGITIGSGCLFGTNVSIFDHNHRFNLRDLRPGKQGFTQARVVIGENSWLGANVVVLKGVTIGKNCVVGANCVVSKDLPDNTVMTLKHDDLYNYSKVRFKNPD